MSDLLAPTRTVAFEARLKKRYAAERRFRLAGLGAVLFSLAVLVILLFNMAFNGIGGSNEPKCRYRSTSPRRNWPFPQV